MKTILGLDLGTNSIGWALIKQDFEKKEGKILGMGSRIVSIDGAEVSDFKKGQQQTKNANRRIKKGARVGNKRYKLRRNKLIYVLEKLGMLPNHIKLSESFENPLRLQKINVLPIPKNTPQLTVLETLKLRVKAIHEEVSAKELGTILYKFNQLRGYAGGDDEDVQDDLNEVLGLKSDKSFPSQITSMAQFKILCHEPTDEITRKKKVFKVEVEDIEGKIWEGTTLVQSMTVGDTLELKKLVRQNTTNGELTSIEFSMPGKSSWRRNMENMEKALESHSQHNGRKTYLSEYFLDVLKENKWKRIRNNIILRARYIEEFDAILKRQSKYFDNISESKIKEIAYFLFPGPSITQQQLRKEAMEGGIIHIIRNQIIYFQRELQDQSHLISDCRFEPGEKVVAKSHPVFQEFRIWEQINKLSINRKTLIGETVKGRPKYVYQDRPIPASLKEFLFDELNQKQDMAFAAVFKALKKFGGFDENVDFFNGLDKKSKLTGNTTKLMLKKRLGRFWNILNLENTENLIELWDILYHSKGNEYDLNSERNKNIFRYLERKGIVEPEMDKIIIAISCIRLPRDYASLSLRAIKQVLPFVRAGKYYDYAQFSENTREKIIRLLNEHTNDTNEKPLQTYLEQNESEVLSSGGFINAYALMLIYGQHTAKQISEMETLSSFNNIKPLERHSLRNPLIEQMVNETLMVVKDIWRQFDIKPDEIKVELARELKNNIRERKKMHEANQNNRKNNERIRERLIELKKELSSGNLEKYKLWESQKNNSPEYLSEYEATANEIEKVKLWEEQGHLDPYTGQPIPLSGLFSGLYDVDHIIPQSRYFDDSLSNKVVCLRAVNKDKGNRTPMEYFETGSTSCKVLAKEKFLDTVSKRFYGRKRKNLLTTKIPEDPVERQKKETQYITVKVKEELGKIVGSKNVKVSSGGVTHYLRNHWGITEIFKKIMLGRFEEYHRKKSESIYHLNKEQKVKDLDKLVAEGFILPNENENLEEFSERFSNSRIFRKNNNLVVKGYSKRLDHRHHAMDAIIIACTNEKVVKRLNDLNKHLQEWVNENWEKLELSSKASEERLEEFLTQENKIRSKSLQEIEKFRAIVQPWEGFLKDIKHGLYSIIVSHKPKDKLLLQYDEKDKRSIKIRGELHEGTNYGLSGGFETYRVPLSKFSENQFQTEKNIENIVDKNLKQLIRTHYKEKFKGKKTEAFGSEGIMSLNKHLSGFGHTPIRSIKIYRKKIDNPDKYKISLKKLDRKKAYNNKLYVLTGSNYLFAVLEKNGKRIYDVISFYDAVDLLKENFNQSADKMSFDKHLMFKKYFEEENGAKLLFMLKQLDMVYLPEENEEVVLDYQSPLYDDYWKSSERAKNIYTVNKFSGKEIYFTHHTIADVIEKKFELGSQNMLQLLNGRKIVAYCFPIVLDKLGNIQGLGIS